MSGKGRRVLVTTQHRGVFAGELVSEDGDVVVLDRMRMCVYWHAEVRGVLGLAQRGPTKNCRVTPAVERGLLRGVTAVVDLTDAAWRAWEAEPWS